MRLIIISNPKLLTWITCYSSDSICYIAFISVLCKSLLTDTWSRTLRNVKSRWAGLIQVSWNKNQPWYIWYIRFWTRVTFHLQLYVHKWRQWRHSVVDVCTNIACFWRYWSSLRLASVWWGYWIILLTVLGTIPFLCPIASTETWKVSPGYIV